MAVSLTPPGSLSLVRLSHLCIVTLPPSPPRCPLSRRVGARGSCCGHRALYHSGRCAFLHLAPRVRGAPSAAPSTPSPCSIPGEIPGAPLPPFKAVQGLLTRPGEPCKPCAATGPRRYLRETQKPSPIPRCLGVTCPRPHGAGSRLQAGWRRGALGTGPLAGPPVPPLFLSPRRVLIGSLPASLWPP